MIQPPRFAHFARLGLQRNPFGTLTEIEQDALTQSVCDAAALLAGGASVQIMGERGRGKTTLLRALRRHLMQAGQPVPYESLPEGQSRLTTPLTPPITLFALDEAQRLAWWDKARLWRHIRRARGRLLVTTHADLTGWFRVYGLPVRTIRVNEFTTPALLHQILVGRITAAARPDAAPVTLTAAGADWLWARFGDDVRGAEQALYEVYQRWPHERDIDAAGLAAIFANGL